MCSSDTVQTLVNAFVTSRLEYCNRVCARRPCWRTKTIKDICIKITFIPQRNIILSFRSSNMAAVHILYSILFGLPNTELQKLQRVQNTAARRICNTNKFDHITPILVKLHWLPVRHRINFKILLITFKDIHGLAPKYLSELLTRKNKCNYNLRSTSETLLQQPGIKTLRTLGDGSFTVAAPALWNNLSNLIRSATSINSFKKLLNTHLFKIAFDL